MGTSNISGIGNVFSQGQISGTKGLSQEEELEVAFNEVMSQMQSGIGNNMMTESDYIDAGLDSVSNSSQIEADYDRYGNRGVKIQDGSCADKVDEGQVTEKVEEFSEEVKDILEDELGVTEAQIEEAMKTLNLSFADLMNPKQLASLVAELTGTKDMGTLLCSEEFMDILHAVGDLGENLLRELGISAEQLSQMIADMENAVENVQMTQGDVVQIAQDNLTQTDAIQSDLESGGTEKLAISEAMPEEMSDDVMVVNEKVITEETQTGAVVAKDEEAEMPITNKEESSLGGQQSQQTGAQARNDMTANVNQNLTEQVYSQVENSVSGEFSQVDVSNIIKQIVEFSRVTLSNTATTMEMQLNPENLGKIFMELTSKDGVVSAHITAQNEAVKEALEIQLVEFKQNMNQAGVKVDAVEVTVGNHEFERNLEQNAKQQERQAEQQEKSLRQSTRHINLNDLDELSGLMTEEESLVAQMMAEQGNSVDFTA